MLLLLRWMISVMTPAGMILKALLPETQDLRWTVVGVLRRHGSSSRPAAESVDRHIIPLRSETIEEFLDR